MCHSVTFEPVKNKFCCFFPAYSHCLYLNTYTCIYYMTCFQYAKNGVVKNSPENKLRVLALCTHSHTYVHTGYIYRPANKHINIRASQPCRTPQHPTTCVSVHKRVRNVAFKLIMISRLHRVVTCTKCFVYIRLKANINTMCHAYTNFNCK